MSLKIITAPTAEPITVDEAKLHLRVDATDDDALITALIVAARQGAEHITGRALMPQTLEMALDGFYDHPGYRTERHAYRVTLQRPPLVSLTSVKYLDDAGVLQTMAEADYLLDDYSEPARLMPAYATCWPTTRCQANAVLIRYDAGYADADSVPQAIKQWMLLQIGAMYENRETVAAVTNLVEMPFADRLLDPYRIWGA